MFRMTLLMACLGSLALAMLPQNSTAQQTQRFSYPATQYSSFPRGQSNSAFAVTPPLIPDGVTLAADGESLGPAGDANGTPGDYRSMSPDSWENAGFQNQTFQPPPAMPTPAPRANQGQGSFSSKSGYQGSNDFQVRKPTDTATPDSGSSDQFGATNSFQSASFAKSSSQPTANSTKLWNAENGFPVSPEVPGDIRYQESTQPAQKGYPLFSSNGDAVAAEPTPAADPNSSSEHSGWVPPASSYPASSFTNQTPGPFFGSGPAYENTAYPNQWSSQPFTSSTVQTMAPSMVPSVNPGYRPDLGHRSQMPTVRTWGSEDVGQEYDFEAKKTEYPPMSEILATGRYFASATMLYLKPSFQGNTAIASTQTGVTSTFDFDYEVAPQFQVGFESKYGPGLEINYWQYDESSNPADFTSNGVDVGTTSIWMRGANQWSRLSTANNGDSLDALHSLDIETVGANFFKEVKFPISRMTGKFGLQYTSIFHEMDASLRNSGGARIGRLVSRSDMRAVGPQFTFEYFRPIGHTKFEFVTTGGGAVLFGRQDQTVRNSVTGEQSRIGADEFLTIVNFTSGLQYRKMLAEKRYLFARAGVTYQSWMGGGTAVLPQDDFGLRGFTLTVGYNR